MWRTIIQKSGNVVSVTITGVKLIPELWDNLFSSIGKGLTKEIRQEHTHQ
jgi:hypothetical protein